MIPLLQGVPYLLNLPVQYFNKIGRIGRASRFFSLIPSSKVNSNSADSPRSIATALCVQSRDIASVKCLSLLIVIFTLVSFFHPRDEKLTSDALLKMDQAKLSE